MAPRIITDQQSAFLKFELERGNDQRRKVALQTLSHLYRTNNALKSTHRKSIETVINGIVLETGQDLKVVRWCLNSLAYVGQRATAAGYVSSALRNYEGNPEITAAGIAALSKMYGNKISEVPEFQNFDPTLRVLAAMQHTPAKDLDISKIKIDINNSSPDILKLALITIGLKKEIENLLHPKHSNGTIIKALGQHDDKIVVQYSVWAIIENFRLAMSDLGVNLDEFDKLPPNVQSKILQLILEREPDPHKKHRFVSNAPFNPQWEPREGLARNLRNKYYDGLEGVTLDWFNQENDEVIKAHLAEHFGRYSDVCAPYLDKAQQIVEADPGLKERILLGAEGRALYGIIKGKDLQDGNLDFFGYNIPDLMANIQKTAPNIPEFKVLYLAASPVDGDSLRVDKEAREIKNNLRNVASLKVKVIIDYEWAVRVSSLQDLVSNGRPDILHFSGHGVDGGICFEDNDGNGVEVDGPIFADLIRLAGNSIRCVVLNACESAQISKHIKSPVKFLIGCDGSIDDEAAVAFSRAFYNSLARGESYKRSFELGRHEVQLEFGRVEAKKYRFYEV